MQKISLRTIVSLFLFTVILFSGIWLVFGDEKDYRIIDIPERENGYHDLINEVITTRAEFDKYIEKVKKQKHWNGKSAFLESLIEAEIDFEREALVIIQLAEGSGSNGITFFEPVVEADKLICRIGRVIPEIGTMDMAYYCFAIVVDKNRIKTVEVQPDGKEDCILSIEDKNK